MALREGRPMEFARRRRTLSTRSAMRGCLPNSNFERRSVADVGLHTCARSSRRAPARHLERCGQKSRRRCALRNIYLVAARTIQRNFSAYATECDTASLAPPLRSGPAGRSLRRAEPPPRTTWTRTTCGVSYGLLVFGPSTGSWCFSASPPTCIARATCRNGMKRGFRGLQSFGN